MRDQALELEDPLDGEVTFVALRPEMTVRGRLDELDVQPDLLSHALHAPLDDPAGAYLLADLGNGLQVGSRLVSHHRRT